MAININGRLTALTRLIETAGELHPEYKLQQDGQHGGWTLRLETIGETEPDLYWWRTAAGCHEGTHVWRD